MYILETITWYNNVNNNSPSNQDVENLSLCVTDRHKFQDTQETASFTDTQSF